MAFTAHQDERMLEELRDVPEVVAEKAKSLAQLIRAAKHVVVFTGAGISTAAGIADYRGPNGVWTLSAKGEQHKIRSANMTSAVPTFAHMSLVALMQKGLVHHIISPNVDGLHRKSGIPKDNLSELHGNSNIEYCSTCRREYLRDFNVSHSASTLYNARAHATGRRCIAAGCGGELHDTIINFGESLPIETVHKAFAQSDASDLFIVLGSSLTVRPASEMPRAMLQQGGKLAIVNLQRTAQDADAHVRAHCGINDFLQQVLTHLDVSAPAFRLSRRAALWRPSAGGFCCAGLDSADGAPATLFRCCEFRAAGKGSEAVVVEGSSDSVVFSAPSQVSSDAASVRCEFYRHYGEPDVELELPPGCEVRHFSMSLDPQTENTWTVELLKDSGIPSVDDIAPGKGGAATSAIRGSPAAAGIHDTVDHSGWFAVQPIHDCPHTAAGIMSADQLCFDPKAPCGVCQNVGENMMCLGCQAVFCGRHVQQHMLSHHEATGHPIVSGFTDLSFWCYKCDQYLKPENPRILPYYAAMHTAKFGVPPPFASSRRVQVAEGSAAAASAAGSGTGAASASAGPAATVRHSSALERIEETIEDTTDCSNWFAVAPVDDCPHTARGIVSADQFRFDPQTPCGMCQSVGENMLCLGCQATFCGRHVQQHMLEHHEATDHPIVSGMADLSFWCYKCDQYLKPNNCRILPYYAAMHTAKFGVPPPFATGRVHVASSSSSSPQ